MSFESIKSRFPTILAVLLLIAYLWLFATDLSGKWFNPNVTTDDATQQIFPFYKAIDSELFQNDIIYDAMRGYLAPLHWVLGYTITLLTRDPIMTGHWIMLIQLVLTCSLLWWGVSKYVGTIGACAAIAWFIHTRHIVQRLAGGLPRGWSAVVLAGFIACSLRNSTKGMIALLFFAALINPPIAALVGLAYGFKLMLEFITNSEVRTRKAKEILIYGIFGLLVCGILVFVTKRPDSIGQMVGPSEVTQIPEFNNPGGRFPFVPQPSVSTHLDIFAFQAFFSRFYRDLFPYQKPIVCGLVVLSFFGLTTLAIIRSKRATEKSTPWSTFLALFLAIAVLYFASRHWMFKLYVPDRHLQFPLAFLWITFFTVMVPCVFSFKDNSLKKLGYYLCFGVILFCCSGSGLQGIANFNYPLDRAGPLTKFVKLNIGKDKVLAGDPISMDPIALVSQRSIYVSTETYHPFYPKYLEEMRRRYVIAVSATYAKNLRDLYAALKGEKIDYFIFNLGKLDEKSLESPRSFEPHQAVVNNLIKSSNGNFAFKEILKLRESKKLSKEDNFILFANKSYVLIDVKLLGSYLNEK